MRRFVVCENIRRYRQMLANETNAERRRVIEGLLAEETEIWAGLLGPDATGDEAGDADEIKPAQESY
jgi:hypothetical protein